MREITDIYQGYKIMPNLQLHQLRVAAVAKQICDSFVTSLDTDAILRACLLHDMGNIIKFDLEYTKREFPEFFKEHSFEDQKFIQEQFIEKYGPDENHATLEIAKELGLSEQDIDLIHDVVSHAMKDDPTSFNLTSCICKYADMRVSPRSVLSLKDRLEEWHARDNRVIRADMEALYSIFSEIETKIFAQSSIKPSDITDESIKDDIENLKKFSL